MLEKDLLMAKVCVSRVTVSSWEQFSITYFLYCEVQKLRHSFLAGLCGFEFSFQRLRVIVLLQIPILNFLSYIVETA